MVDIYVAWSVLALLSVGVGWGTWRVTRKAPRWSCDVLGVLAIVGMLLYIGFVWDNVWLAKVLPYSNLIVLGNWFPLLTSFLAALVWHRTTGHVFRRVVGVAALTTTGVYSLVAPFLGEAPRCDNTWDQDICVQTTKNTCTAACAATLLHAYNIPASEQEMAELCFTRRGTTWLGLYHGLKRKTANTAWDVEVVQCGAAELRRLATKPMILRVGLEKNAQVDADYQIELGWRPGVGHSVVLIRFVGKSYVEIIDPTPNVGHEQWTPDNFDLLWRGQAVRLVPRPVRR